MDFNAICNNLLSEDDNKNPEQKILKFLNIASEILGSGLNSNECTFFGLHSMDNIVPSDNNLAEYWNKTELKEILLSDHEFGNRTEVFVRVILDFMTKQMENANVENCIEIFNYAATLNRFLKVCAVNNIMNMKGCVLKFLAELFQKLEHISSEDFIKNGPLYQFIARLIENFKEIKFVQDEIMLNINNKLKKISAFLKHKQATNEFYGEICYESLLLYLTILKGVLKYKLIRLFELDEEEQKNYISMEIKKNLNIIVVKLPEYVQIIINECNSLL